MKKLIILFLILSILIVGCKSYTQSADRQPTQPPPNPAVGGGCGVAENENQNTKIKYVGVEAAL